MTKPDDDHNDDVDNDEDDNDDVDHDDDDRGTASVSNCLRRWLGGEHFADKPFDDKTYDDDHDDDVDNDDDDNDDVDDDDDDRGTALLLEEMVWRCPCRTF